MDRSIFISKDALKHEFQNPDAKFIVNLWLMTKSSTQSIDEFQDQWMANLYSKEINEFESLDSMLNDIFRYIDSISMPSKLAAWISNFTSSEQLRSIAANQLQTRPLLVLPAYSYTEDRLMKIDGSQPSLAIIYFMNHLNPQFAGFYLENILAYCIYDDIELWKSNELNEINVQRLNDPDSLTITNADVEMIRHQCETDGEFKSIPHSILFATFIQACAKKLTSNVYVAFNRFAEMLNDHVYVDQVMNYIRDLASTSFVKSLHRFKNERFHSIECYKTIDGKYLSGELDFVFPNTIIDAKCTKASHINQWAAQLFLYKRIIDHPSMTLQIISFLNNTIYKFNFQ